MKSETTFKKYKRTKIKKLQLDDKLLERIIIMSERKYNTKKNNTNDFFNNYHTEAEGVEKYNRPAWLKYVTVGAAALILTGGIAGSTMKLMKNRAIVPSVQASSDAAATSVISKTGTTETKTADTTTVSSESSTSVTGSETTAVASEIASISQTAQITAAPANASTNAPTATDAPAQQTQNTVTTVNTNYEDQCYDIINREIDDTITLEEIIQVPCSEYLDFSDTFTATARVTHETFCEGQPLLDEPLEFTLKFVHYTDPKFNTIDELKSFVDNYNDCWRGGKGVDSDILFGQTIVPGQVITNDLFITEKIFVYTVYNGKIYRAIDNNLMPEELMSHDDFYTSERMAFRWGHDYLRNVTANSFEAYRVQEDGNGGYYGRYKYYYYDGVQWKKDCSKERDISDAECRQIMGF